jgi:DNA-binding MarR family transcriptional regulator
MRADDAAELRMVPPIHRAAHRVGLYLAATTPRRTRAAGERPLSQGEAHVLAQLAAASPATIAALHRGLAHTRSTLTSILDRLSDAGLITREVAPADRRTFNVDLTPRGRVIARRVHQRIVDLETAVADLVSAADLRGFERVVEAIETEAYRRR